MEIAKCPTCGTELGLEDLASDQIRLILAVGALISTAAVTGMLMELPEYDGAKEGFDERIAEITEQAHQTVDHLTEWGGAFDG